MRPSSKNVGGLLVTLLSVPAALTAADRPPPVGWFVWPGVEPVGGSALDVSRLNASPAGEAGRIGIKDGHFALPDGSPVRFWGCNLSGEVAFPPITEIEPLARRLAKGGINIARLHHLDNEWGRASSASLWPKRRSDHSTIDPQQLDRLHRLIAALKAHGIYSNLNLKVSKSLSPADGFPESVRQLPIFQKRVDIFDPRMIELQKSYARRLLTAKNPYTGLSAVEDPAVAIVEINNENSLLGFWTRDLGRGLDKLPEPFRGELTRQWNTWLARQYANDEALAQAWNATSAPLPGDNLLPAGAVWETHTMASAQFQLTPGADGRALDFDVTTASNMDWHAQARLRGLSVTDGEVYTLSFTARADRKRTLGIGLGLDQMARPEEAWRSFGLLDSVMLGTEWTPVRFVFVAHSSNQAPGALGLNVGQATGHVSVKDLNLAPGADGVGLLPGQSPRSATVPIPTLAGKQQWSDWIHFLADTERAYADEMRRFLRDELGVKAPIVGSQIEYGGLIGMSREHAMDFADTHAYWEHPDIENGDFNSPNWTVRNTPQLARFGPTAFGDLGDRALLRIANKPFALSEYDHSAPSEFACEMYPTLATFACRQDWDAIYPFDIGANGSRNPDGKIGRFFDQLHHPAKWGFQPFAALVYRDQYVPPAAVSWQLDVGTSVWKELHHADMAWSLAQAREDFSGARPNFLTTRFAINDRVEGDQIKGAVSHTPGPLASPISLIAAQHGQVFVLQEKQAAAIVGFVGDASIDAGTLQVSCPRFGREFAAITAVALDRQPLSESGRVLVTIVGRAQNQGIQWNADRTSVGASWGHGPPIVEHVPATITLQARSAREVHALAPDGTRAKQIAVKRNGDALTFVVGAEDHTIHYEIIAP